MTPNFEFLHQLRDVLGPTYGSEDLCVLLYSLVKRERPSVVVELGTGLGVTSAWIAAAMAENQHGTLYTFDNGAHFAKSAERIAGQLDGDLAVLRANAHDYPQFIKQVFQQACVCERAKMSYTDMSLHSLGWLDDVIPSSPQGPLIDMVFSDFNHSADAVGRVIGQFLPRLSPIASIFIDSASTSLASMLTLERITDLFKQGTLPRELAALHTPAGGELLKERIRNSHFQLVHLIERQDRAQNSTAWLRIEPAGIIPAQITSLH